MYNYPGQQPIPQQQTGYAQPAQQGQATGFNQPMMAPNATGYGMPQQQIAQSTGYNQQQYMGQQMTGANLSMGMLQGAPPPVPAIPQQYMNVASSTPSQPTPSSDTQARPNAGNHVTIPPGMLGALQIYAGSHMLPHFFSNGDLLTAPSSFIVYFCSREG